MARPAPNDPDGLIEILTDIRARNNTLWIEVIRIAMKHAPEEARTVFKAIERNDVAITQAIRDFYGEDG